MKVFVTGGTGFVGLPTIRELVKRGHKILALTRDHSGTKKLSSFNGVKTVTGDFALPEQWKAILRRFRPEGAIHLACENILDDNEKLAIKNITGSLAVFRTLHEVGCKKVIGIGSCREYGDPKGKVADNMPLKPKNIFYAAKTALYHLGSAFFSATNIDFIWVRPFYIYGPRQRSGSLIPHTIRAFLVNKKPDIKNKFAANDFIFVNDVAIALVDILEKHKKGQSDVYNIGSGKLTGVVSVSDLIFGKQVVVKGGQGFFADISRIKKEIKWKPKIAIKEGIELTKRLFVI